MMWGWIPLTLQLFQRLPHQRAVIASIVLGWMFLPVYSYSFPGIPDYSKSVAATIAVLIATASFASKRFEGLEFDAQDLIVGVWCLTPLFASIDNGLGIYDGVSASKNYVTKWLFPYLVGRMYFKDWISLSELAWGVFLGALIYAPLAAYEIVMSPQLHNKFYGWHPHDFIQSVRGNSYRPVIFMNHGLMVGMWMMCGCVAGAAIWKGGQLGKLSGVLGRLHLPKLRPGLVLLGLIGVFVLSKSMGATFMFLVAWGLLECGVRFGGKILLCLLILYTPYSIATKIGGNGGENKVVEWVRHYSEDRAASLEYRLINEEMLVDKAMIRPVFGWGGWGRSRIINEEGKDAAVTDAYWVIVLGTTGVVGVTFFCLVVLLPAWRFVSRMPKGKWQNPHQLMGIALMLELPLFAWDCLLNDMMNPVYMVVAGGLISLTRSAGPFRFPEGEAGTEAGEALSPQLKTRYV